MGLIGSPGAPSLHNMEELSLTALVRVVGGAFCPIKNDTREPIVVQPEHPGQVAQPKGAPISVGAGQTGRIPEGNFSTGGLGSYCEPGKDAFRATRNGSGMLDLLHE